MAKKFVLTILLLALVLTAAAKENGLSQSDSIRRFAMVVGANDGGKDRVKLRYAVDDAKTFLKVMNKIGGIFPIDSLLYIEPDRRTFIKGLKKLHKMVAQAKAQAKKIEVIFYYSGHSNEEAIMLGNQRLYYAEIKKAIDSLPADVHIAVLDSCSSGAFTRLKGGRHRAPFLFDSSNDMKGYAFMTSSSSDEASQESDKIRSSFFTHSLVTGLRGAADMTQDGRITLSEAYQFAYNETLARTEKTLSGPQHPNYNIQMSGTGDVVLTDIRNSSAIMILDKTIQGRLFVRDGSDHLVVEVRKPAGRPMQIGLEEGNYTLTNEKNGLLFEAQVDLNYGQQLMVKQSQFKELERETAVARGEPLTLLPDDDRQYEFMKVQFQPYPKAELYQHLEHRFVFGLLGTYSGKLNGASLAFGPCLAQDRVIGAQISGVGAYSEGRVEGAQLSGVFAYAKKDMIGIQLSGIFNSAEQYMGGYQGTGIFNYAGGNVFGIQNAGIYNQTDGDLFGLQISGVFNVAAGDVSGVQIAGVFNIAPKNLWGFQMGTVNITGDSTGMQMGLVNIAKQQNGFPLGLVNISDNGGIDVLTWTDSIAPYNLGVRFRSGMVYTMFSTGRKDLEKHINDYHTYGYHFGLHIPISIVSLDMDMGSTMINYGDKDRFTPNDQISFQFRFIMDLQFNSHVSVFVGGGTHYLVDGIEFDIKEKNDDIEVNLKSEMNSGTFNPLYLGGVKVSF